MTWFLGADNYFSHPADDSAGHRLALATLMANGHARPSQIQKTLGTAPRSLVRWRKQLDTQGAGSFYQPWGVRGSVVLNVETSAQCQRLLDEGHQTAIIITARTLASPTIAGRMFSRWCQENDFGYMMEHHDIDGLVQYGSDEIPGAPRIVNPAWRELDRQLGRLTDTGAGQKSSRSGETCSP